jgi:diguanylate cyclase (GGDEF)-like protein/PAS domain S-box-containing protein
MGCAARVGAGARGQQEAKRCRVARPRLPVAGHPAVSGLGRHRRHLAWRVEERLAKAIEPAPARADVVVVAARPHFDVLFEHSPVPHVLVYAGRAGLLANQAFGDLFGYEPDVLATMSLTQLVHERDKADVQGTREWLESGDARGATIERQYVRADGTAFWGRSRITVVPATAEAEGFLLATIEDITEQVEAAVAVAESEATLRTLVDNSPDIIITLYHDGRWNASRAGTELLGYPKGFELDGGALALVHPEDRDRAHEALAVVLATPGVASGPVELRLRASDGRYLEFECMGQSLGADAPKPGIVVTARNITERKHMQRALQSVEAQFRAVFEHAPFSVSMVDLDGTIIDINYAGCAMLGRTREMLIGTPADNLVHPDDRERAIDAATRQLGGDACVSEFRLVRADESELWVMSSAAIVEPGGDEEPYVVSIQADITERRALEAALAHEATRDPLTGVMNRGAVMTQLELALLQRHASPLGLLFVDLDYFKIVNDTHGHEAGDAVLVTVARRIHDAVREGDIVGRIGGDEFVVICHEVTGEREALEIGERLRAAVAETITVRGGIARVDASVGVVLGHTNDDAAALMRRVDQAAYAAKRAGRGRVLAAGDDTAPAPVEERKRSA